MARVCVGWKRCCNEWWEEVKNCVRCFANGECSLRRGEGRWNGGTVGGGGVGCEGERRARIDGGGRVKRVSLATWQGCQAARTGGRSAMRLSLCGFLRWIVLDGDCKMCDQFDGVLVRAASSDVRWERECGRVTT